MISRTALEHKHFLPAEQPDITRAKSLVCERADSDPLQALHVVVQRGKYAPDLAFDPLGKDHSELLRVYLKDGIEFRSALSQVDTL